MIRPTQILKADPIETERGAHWSDQAACLDVDPEIFFQPPGDHDAEESAKAICARCPVTRECLDTAIDEGRVGVWGGLTDDERRRLKLRRQKARRKRHYVNGMRDG